MLGIGVASPGGIDVRRGLVVNPPWLPGWRGVPLVQELGAATGLPVVLDKDTNAALTAENWSAGQRPEERVQEETVLYVFAGAGIGSAVSVGGRVHHGAAALLEGYGTALGEALRSLVGIHDPHRVVLGGPHWDVLALHVLPTIEERRRWDAPPGLVAIESSQLGNGVGALGAAALFLQRELSPAVR